MNEEAFVLKNKDNWIKLEEFNSRLNRKNLRALSKDEVERFALLYRKTSHDLAYSRTHYKSGKTSQYLNQIVGVSHNFFHVREKTSAGAIFEYFKKGFPCKANEYIKYTAAAFIIFIAGFFAAFFLVMYDPKYAGYFFLPDQNTEQLSPSQWDYPMISSFIMTNNIRVSLMAAAYGITAGIGTVYILFYNGMVIGSLTYYMLSSGQSMLNYWSLILPHGFLELCAIFISGAVGLIIGRSMLVPGDLSRKDSLVKAGKEAARLVPGIILMLVIAGLIEGFFTPLGISPAAKLGFSIFTLVGVIFYFKRQSV